MKLQNQINRSLAAMLTMGLCVIGTETLTAATDTWNGGATPDGDWVNPGNWNGVAPSTNDLLIFSGGTQTSTTNNYPAGTLFNNITFNSGSSPFVLSGNSMVLSSPT